MNNITEKPPRGGSSSRWRFVVDDGVLTLQRNTDDAFPFRTYEIVATFGTDGTVEIPGLSGLGGSVGDTQVAFGDGDELAGDAGFTYDSATNVLSLTGSANTLSLAGSATTLPVTLTATGTDASIPIQLVPKGNQGFVQFGASTLGAAGWAGSDLNIEIRDVTTKTASSYGLFADRTMGDFTDGELYGLYSNSRTKGAGATLDPFVVNGIHAYGFSALPIGRTVSVLSGLEAGSAVIGAGTATIAYGAYGEVSASGGGAIGTAYGFKANMLDTVTTPNTGKAYAFYANRDGSIANSEWYGFYANDASTAAVNPYFLWYDSPGVYRVKGDGVMAYYNPGFATKYTPGLANYERIVQQWNSNVAEYGVEAGGTGTQRVLRLLGSAIQCKATGAGAYVGITASAFTTASEQGAFVAGPYGTSAGQTGEFQLRELAANGTNYVGIKAPDALSGNLIFTMPATDAAGPIVSNGSAVLSTVAGANGSVVIPGVATLTVVKGIITSIV